MILLLIYMMIGSVQEKCPGDANEDGKVDPMDLGYVSSYLGCPMTKDNPLLDECCMADLNEDEVVDGLDIGIVLDHMGEECGAHSGG